MNYITEIQSYFNKEIEILEKLPIEKINEVINVCEKARKNKKRVYVCGNGGSATTAAHFACDFNKGVNKNKKSFYDVECLSDSVPLMMAIANDICYEDIFVFPLQNKLQPEDVVIGISGSGNSENVIRAIKYANEIGAETIAFVGYDGGKLQKIAEHSVHVDIPDMQISEDVHMLIVHAMMHVLCELVE